LQIQFPFFYSSLNINSIEIPTRIASKIAETILARPIFNPRTLIVKNIAAILIAGV